MRALTDYQPSTPIADKYSGAGSTAYMWCRKCGARPAEMNAEHVCRLCGGTKFQARKKLNPEQQRADYLHKQKLAVELWEQGLSLQQIKRRLGVGYDKVKKMLLGRRR